MNANAGSTYTLVIKRGIDCIAAFFLLLLCLPIFLFLAVLVFMDLGSPILFRQSRPGLNGHIFHIFKFRTMTFGKDRNGKILSDAERLTALGRFLRKTSLDELPELWNVWRGDMSLVGPRPLLVQYLTRYTPEQARRHQVRPGITGWAQVHGRNALTWEEKFELDVWYVDHVSFFVDVKILVMTVAAVLACRDIDQPGQATAEEFRGSRRQETGGFGP